MKTAPRTSGVFIDDSLRSSAGDTLPAESALALAAAAGARQLLDDLRPGLRSIRVQRGPRAFLVLTDR
jgi:hypothetical protein